MSRMFHLTVTINWTFTAVQVLQCRNTTAFSFTEEQKYYYQYFILKLFQNVIIDVVFITLILKLIFYFCTAGRQWDQ